MLKGKGIIIAVWLLGVTVPFPARAEMPPEDLVVKARAAAAADRHAEAIQDYLAAIRSKPALRSDLSVELGHQYTWADMPDSAIDWYEYYLLDHPDDMEAKLGVGRALAWSNRLDESEQYYADMLPSSGDRRTEVELGLARVRVWKDDLGGAEALYREILEEDSTNVDARLGLAQMRNWSGRHREAETMYREFLADEPGNEDALEGLAYAQSWQGRNDLAYDTATSGETDARMARTAAEVGREDRGDGHHMYTYRDNTTDGIYGGLRNSFTYYPRHITWIGAVYEHGVFNQIGFPKITRDELGAQLHHRFSSYVALTTYLAYQFNRFDDIVVPPSTTPTNDFDLPVWDAYVTINPKDWVRLDVGNSRTVVDIPRPIFRKIHVTTTAIGLDWRLNRRVTTTAGLRFSNFSDTNRRIISAAEVNYTLPWNVPNVSDQFIASGDLSYWDTDKENNNGYYSPLTYTTFGAKLRWVGDIGRHWNVDVAGRFGQEKEKSQEFVSVGSFEGSIAYRITDNVSLRAGYTKSGSRLTSNSGFRSNLLYISLDYPLHR